MIGYNNQGIKLLP